MREHRTTLARIAEDGSEIMVEVFADCEPEEPPVYYPNDRAHPGSRASVTITEARIDGKSVEWTAEEAARWEDEIMQEWRDDEG